MREEKMKIVIASALFLVLVIVIPIICIPYIEKLSQPEVQLQFKQWASENKFYGIMALLGIQILQIVIAFIPGEPVEIIAGAVLGTVNGLVICLLGCVIASSIVFSISKQYGRKILRFFFTEETISKWSWVQHNRRMEFVTFLLFLVPGTPKDLLTYIAGISNMKLGKFIVLSAFARIPSIISSTIIGATMIEGRWRFSIALFVLTGTIGIAGIWIEDRIVSRFKKNSHADIRISKSECMDIVEASRQKELYPLIFCHLQMKGLLDIEKLKEAVGRSGRIIPEIFYIYDFEQGIFIDKGFCADHVILEQQAFPQEWKWDLSEDTQLKIIIYSQRTGTHIVIGISHILCDGKGFLQYLYLLADLYNGKEVSESIKNQRAVSPYLKNIKVGRITDQTKANRKYFMNTIKVSGKGATPYCLWECIGDDDLKKLKDKASIYHATLNDVFMTAYACVLSRIQNTETVNIPCPADLRSFIDNNGDMTIGNLTGIYRTISIEVRKDRSFVEILQQVHIEIELQKSRYRCFEGIRELNTIYKILPVPYVSLLCRMTYHLKHISYTNLGIIDRERLQFSNCEIKACFVTGSYRKMPDFQLSISTINSVCTLNCTVLGNDEWKEKCEGILRDIKKELLIWASEY